jgi:hypothetical protein
MSNGVQVFENPFTQSALDRAISQLAADPNAHFAAVAHHIYDNNGQRVQNVTKVSFVCRLPAGFSVAVGAYKDWSKGDAGVEGQIAFRA